MRARDAVAGALVVTVLTFLGTMLWFYATLFMSYLPAAFFTLWAVWRFEWWVERRAAQGASADGGDPPLFTVGLLLGCAVLCEYTVALVACIFGAYVLAVIPRRARVWRLVAGGVLPLLPFLVYTYAIFGRFAIPYQFERNDHVPRADGGGFHGPGRAAPVGAGARHRSSVPRRCLSTRRSLRWESRGCGRWCAAAGSGRSA